MMSKHTQGPFTAHKSTWTNDVDILSPDDVQIGKCFCMATMADGEEDANANLFIAAPDMLEALKATRNNICGMCNAISCESNCSLVESINAAIAKAEGKTD